MVAVSICSIHISNAASSISLGIALSLSIYRLIAYTSFKPANWTWLISIYVLFQLFIELVFHSENAIPISSLFVKAPLLFFPILINTEIKQKNLSKAITCIGLIITWISLASILLYFLNKEFYDIMVSESKPLPLFSKVYHIEFSLLLSLTALSILYFGIKNRSQLNGQIQLVLALILIISLHILSARTGLLAFYAGLGILLLSNLKSINTKTKVLTGTSALLLFAMLTQVPSLKNRIQNTTEDLNTVINGTDVNNKSFGQRWVAWSASVNSIKKEPWKGYGIKNVKETIDANYLPKHQTVIDEMNKVMPHNVYLESSVQSGVLAGLYYLAFLILGLIWSLKNKRILLSSIIAALMAASIFETITERQSGIIAMLGFLTIAFAVKTVEQKVEKV